MINRTADHIDKLDQVIRFRILHFYLPNPLNLLFIHL